LVELFLPVFNALAEKQLRLSLPQNPTLLWSSLALTFVVGILAGSYPAFVVSAFQPLQVIRGVLLSSLGSRPSLFRKALVVTQFAVAILFISCLMIIHHQLLYIRNKNLGYQKKNVVVLPIFYKDIQSKYELFKREILSNVNVLSATTTSYLPNTESYHQTVWWEGMEEDDYSQMIRWVSVDEDFIKTLGLKIVAGRDFSKELHDELQGAYVLNESAVKAIGWENPIGKLFKVMRKGPVIGVVKDFYFRSLHNAIEPVALHIYPPSFYYLFIRIQPDQLSGTIKFLQEKWRQIFPDRPFDYSFLNDDLEKVYKSEARLGKIFNYFGGLSILIACLGLLGLASFMAERKTKEIGIRKVLGASVDSILALLSKDFVKLVLLANLIAWPIAYYTMSRWLQNFSYRIDISWWVFLLAGGLVLLIALLTVSTQALKAALANPVEALRYE
jgi:putative ABC transport system permease protein